MYIGDIMKEKKCKRVMISVYEKPWNEFVKNCKNQYKTASGVIRELIIKWSEENGDKINGKTK